MTALRVPRDATDDQLWAVVREWTNAVAALDYQRAVEVLAPSDDVTADVLRKIVEEYSVFFGGSAVTPFETAAIHPSDEQAVRNGNFPWHRIYRRDDGQPYHIEYSVPFGGYRSDAVAKFEVEEAGDDLVLAFSTLYVP